MNAPLAEHFTSTGSKFWHHPEALEGLRNGKPRPVVCHIMPTDTCQHTCAFCSVQTRVGESLTPEAIKGFLGQLVPLGLKAVIISGGGNPILYKKDGWDFNDLVDYIKGQGLEIGLITNGRPLERWTVLRKLEDTDPVEKHRWSWKGIKPATLDKLTWVRISMSGLDHKENEVYVPDIDRSKTTLGFSYVYHDIYHTPEEPNHGKVSTPYDIASMHVERTRMGSERFATLTQQIGTIVRNHNPSYVRLLPNCLEPEKIAGRCAELRQMADAIDPTKVFVQFKPPEAPPACWLGYLHPVLNSDGFVYPCDSCVLNRTANHKFAEPWRICHWSAIAEVYSKPAATLIKNPGEQCPGCVFTRSNLQLHSIVQGAPLQPPTPVEHPNFV